MSLPGCGKRMSPHSRLIEEQEVPIAISVILEYAAELVCISEPFGFEDTRLAEVTNRCHSLRQEKILHILSSLREACFLLGVPIDPEVFPWVLSFLPFQLAGEAQDGVDSKDGNEQRFVIRHGSRLAMRNQLHGVAML